MAGWLIVSSRQNFEITSNMGFKQQGLKQRHRKKALQIEPGDLFFYYITGEKKLAALVQVESFVIEGKEKIWVNLGKNPDEQYPWRFEISPLIVLKEKNRMNMSDFSEKLLYFRKWPVKYWQLGLQGQIHALRNEDKLLLKQAFSKATKL